MKIVAVLFAFAACCTAQAAEPPQCSDKGATETVQELFWEEKLKLGAAPTAASGKAWNIYGDFQVHDVTANGYDAGLKRRHCSGSIGKGKRPTRVHYTLQLVEGGSGRYYVNADFSAMAPAVALALREAILSPS